jgi:hypothetical protein
MPANVGIMICRVSLAQASAPKLDNTVGAYRRALNTHQYILSHRRNLTEADLAEEKITTFFRAVAIVVWSGTIKVFSVELFYIITTG